MYLLSISLDLGIWPLPVGANTGSRVANTVTRPGAAFFHRRSSPVWCCFEAATECLPWLFQDTCTGRVAYQPERGGVVSSSARALAEGPRLPLARASGALS